MLAGRGYQHHRRLNTYSPFRIVSFLQAPTFQLAAVRKSDCLTLKRQRAILSHADFGVNRCLHSLKPPLCPVDINDLA